MGGNNTNSEPLSINIFLISLKPQPQVKIAAVSAADFMEIALQNYTYRTQELHFTVYCCTFPIFALALAV